MQRFLICCAVGLGLLFGAFASTPASAHYPYYHHRYHHHRHYYPYYHHRHYYPYYHHRSYYY